jgi:hypothetical protein
VPSAAVTSTVRASSRRAAPNATAPPLPRISVPTLVVSRSTIPAFQRCVAAKSMAGSALIPITPASRTRSTSPAAVISALLGMHPQFRHTPPSDSFSTHSTRLPSCARRMAAVYPPGPPPITITS